LSVCSSGGEGAGERLSEGVLLAEFLRGVSFLSPFSAICGTGTSLGDFRHCCLCDWLETTDKTTEFLVLIGLGVLPRGEAEAAALSAVVLCGRWPGERVWRSLLYPCCSGNKNEV